MAHTPSPQHGVSWAVGGGTAWKDGQRVTNAKGRKPGFTSMSAVGTAFAVSVISVQMTKFEL